MDATKHLQLESAGGETIGVEASAGEPDEQGEQPQEGEEEVDAALEFEHAGLEFLVIVVEKLGGHDSAWSTAEPARGGGARHAEASGEEGGALFAGQDAEAGVV